MARYERDFGYGRGGGFGGRYDAGFRDDDRFQHFQPGNAGWRGYDRDVGRQWQGYGRGPGQDYRQGYDRDFRRGRYADDFRNRQRGGYGRGGYAGRDNNDQYQNDAPYDAGRGLGGAYPGRPAGFNRGWGGYNRNLMYGSVYRSDFDF